MCLLSAESTPPPPPNLASGAGAGGGRRPQKNYICNNKNEVSLKCPNLTLESLQPGAFGHGQRFRGGPAFGHWPKKTPNSRSLAGHRGQGLGPRNTHRYHGCGAAITGSGTVSSPSRSDQESRNILLSRITNSFSYQLGARSAHGPHAARGRSRRLCPLLGP